MSGVCISSNPDVSGIGVRAATYAQNLLSFAPAIYAIYDYKVTPTELETLETQSTTILITGFAILISTIVQALTQRLSSYHASIILNLSWMNNTNTFIYFLLFVYHKVGESYEKHRALGGSSSQNEKFSWVQLTKEALKNRVLWIGSLHLSLMAAVGIWLWSRPASFGSSPPCSLSASAVILGGRFPLSSVGLRIWSLFIYGLLLLPGFNLIIPVGLFIVPYIKYVRAGSSPSTAMPRRPAIIGLIFLGVINAFFLADTEVSIQSNKPLLEEGDSVWTFGQTLALLLLLIPLRDLLETILERRPKALGRRLLIGSKEGQLDVVRYVVELGANTDVLNKDGNTALALAAWKGFLDIVRYLTERGASVNMKNNYGETGHTLALRNGYSEVAQYLAGRSATVNATEDAYGHARLIQAAQNGDLNQVEYLTEHGVNVDARDGRDRTGFILAAMNGHLDVVKYLLEYGADLNAKDRHGNIGLVLAAKDGHLDVVQFLLEHGADVNAENVNGDTALLLATQHRHWEVAAYLNAHAHDLG